MLRLLLWRVLGLLAVLLALALGGWLLDGGLGATLRGAVVPGVARGRRIRAAANRLHARRGRAAAQRRGDRAHSA